MARGINNYAIVLGDLKLLESNINGNTTLPVNIELVQHLGVLE
jgi:hypothetical protein